ncbi:unnamed protein product [Timema podura]|uniref:Uncharacterized protein n=1 Tax=Timema podura TaxID=61482 RepID=A0ABN7P8K0_TIMPD|nr:unnamed protein product [Timema podura]
MAMVLKEFHSSLQEILITFLEMKKFDLKHNEPLHKIRTKLITEMSNKVKQLLCEAENAILNESAGLPDRHTTDIVTWDSNPDHTTVLVQDWGVFAHYKNFLQNWQCIMDDLMSKTKRKVALKMCRPLLKTRN